MLVHLAPGLQPLVVNGVEYMKPGYPLYGYWGVKEHFADANHDGIIEPNEVTFDTALTYMGSSIPTQQASLDNHISLLHGTLSFGVLMTYQGGYKVLNAFAETGADYGTLEAQNVAGTPLWQQARATLANQLPYEEQAGLASGFFEDGTIFRLQELSLTYAMPARWARAVHVRTLSLTGAVRNLAYWTNYTGGDPSVGSRLGYQYQPATQTYVVNNDSRSSGASAVPLARYFQLRLNVGF
jgi:hypothetical protein